jgi:hypothetical protein
MEPFQLLNDEEIGAAYDEGKKAVIALFHRTNGRCLICRPRDLNEEQTHE